ncbi:sugar-binding domain-containing protein [Flammeovirga sp. EKP202]|uniref:glycoside hydrolase family 2 protein n=1 Tax=Flammeovirga sp. EKP202 TaxID=2770592 RepID=UPI00165F6042|nr:sugar-binding domain-containing protein [Flammeovirga sp. EKP202]MBD0401978.1 DUF4982 domain-containing protein [Flammeovirga sp. EKP202]
MLKLIGLNIVLLILSFQALGSDRVNFNSSWKFVREEAPLNVDKLHKLDFDDSQWEEVTLPHTTRLEPLVVNDQWQGISWYRKKFKVQSNPAKKRIFVEFEGAMNIAEVWVNGQYVKKHFGGYLPFVIDMTDYVSSQKENVIVVKLDNTDSEITGPKPLKILDFNTYGGLYRNVWLIEKNPVHITFPLLEEKVAGGGIFVNYPEVNANKASLKIKTEVKNTTSKIQEVKVTQTLYFKNKKVMKFQGSTFELSSNNTKTVTQDLSVKKPKLWDTHSPHLYQLMTEVTVDGKVVDQQRTTIGIKKVEFVGTELYINGQKRYLRGTNRHQEYPYVGYALSEQAEIRDAKLIKEAGFDVIRLSHYPHSTAFMNACDSLGLLTIDAILGWQYYKPTDGFRNQIFQTARDLIRRDRNHANVLLWEVSLNETKMPLEFRKKLSAIVKEEYPIGASYSAGWMNEGYDVFFQARQHRILHPDDQEHWKGPYFVSEYGDWEYYSKNAGLNQHQLDKQTRYETSSRQARAYGEKRLLQQAYNVQEALNDNLQTTAFGDGYWVMFDYNRGYHKDIEFSGIADIFRIEKFAYYFYQSQKDASKKEDAMVKIASYWDENSPLSLKVYSNCEEVKLYLNDQLIGEQKPDQDQKSTNLSHPPFTFALKEFKKGTLRAEGYIKGKKVREDWVKTPEKAHHLSIVLADRAVPLASQDVVFAYIKVVDENGTLVHDHQEEINVSLEGDIQLMNTETLTTDAGIATALIKINSLKKDISIKAVSKSEQLKGSLQRKLN